MFLMTAAREADTVESTESRLSFTLDHVLCSFSRNSLAGVAAALGAAGAVQGGHLVVQNELELLAAGAVAELQIQAPPHHSRQLQARRLAVILDQGTHIRHRFHVNCQGYCRTQGTFLNCHAYHVRIIFSRHNSNKIFTLYVSRVVRSYVRKLVSSIQRMYSSTAHPGAPESL